jgi:AraC-like DNA-binding protein
LREITFRVLTGELGEHLRALAAPQSHFGQISRVLSHIHRDFAQIRDLSSLAREAGMSLSTFHQRFKEVTASPPLQYLKTTRLHKARLLMVNEGATAAGAAQAVGYESASQFSREFRRLFGQSPAAEAARLREHLITLA